MKKRNIITLDYDIIVEDALRCVVKKSLEIVQANGFKDDHHFFISFNSKYPGVIVPSELINSNGDNEVKIILQHQFWELKPEVDKFSVTLSFNGEKKQIVVPYNSIYSFSDPSVNFGLQFKNNIFNEKNESNKFNNEINNISEVKKDDKKDAEIVSLESFRSKKQD